MSYVFEKNKLKSFIGVDLYNHFKKYNLMIAGGTITSLFTGNEINDIDVYGRCNDDILDFATDVIETGNWIVSHTSKATQFTYGSVPVQLIHYQYFNEPDDIFESFDFTVCMAAFDFKTEEFVFHPDFLKHNSQRIIKFNSNTSFPIVSALRVQKYEGKGYKISKSEFIRIIMTCMKLNITSYDGLKDQLGGMYGISYDKLFEDVIDEEFDMQVAIDKIADITLSEEYFTTPDFLDISLEEVLEDIDKSARVCFNHRDKYYRVTSNGNITVLSHKKDGDKIVSIEEAIPFNKLYKFVKKENEQLRSYHDKHFNYGVGELSVANKSRGSFTSSSGGKLYFNRKENINRSSFYGNDDKVLIESEFNAQDLVDIETENSSVTVTEARTIREVPEDEWKQWVSNSIKFPF